MNAVIKKVNWRFSSCKPDTSGYEQEMCVLRGTSASLVINDIWHFPILFVEIARNLVHAWEPSGSFPLCCVSFCATWGATSSLFCDIINSGHLTARIWFATHFLLLDLSVQLRFYWRFCLFWITFSSKISSRSGAAFLFQPLSQCRAEGHVGETVCVLPSAGEHASVKCLWLEAVERELLVDPTQSLIKKIIVYYSIYIW